MHLLVTDADMVWYALAAAHRDGDYVAVVSVLTLAEQRHSAKKPAFDHVVSDLTVIDATRPIADRAAELLNGSGLDGHDELVDAFVVATASFAVKGALVATSDSSHIPRLCKEASDLTGRSIGVVRV